MSTLDPHKLHTPAEVSVITGLSKSFIKDHARANYPHARGGRKAILFGAEHIRLLLRHVEAGEATPASSAAVAPPGDVDTSQQADSPAGPSGGADWLALRSCAAKRN